MNSRFVRGVIAHEIHYAEMAEVASVELGLNSDFY